LELSIFLFFIRYDIFELGIIDIVNIFIRFSTLNLGLSIFSFLIDTIPLDLGLSILLIDLALWDY